MRAGAHAGAEDMEHSGLYYGAVYHIENVPPEQIREDLAAMEAAGMNVVCFEGDGWQSWEPEAGRFALEQLETVLRLCRETALEAVIAVPGWPVPERLKGASDEEIFSSNLGLLEKLKALGAEYEATAFQVDGRQPEGSALARFQTAYLQERGCSVTALLPLESAADPFVQTGAQHFGCGIFHPAGLKNTGSSLNFQGDMARCARGGSFLVAQTQSRGGLGQLPYPGQLRLAAFHHVASGADGVCYRPWHSTPDSDCQGIVGYDGVPGRIYNEIERVGREFARLGSHITLLRKRSRVAVLVSPESARRMPKLGEKSYDDYLQWVCNSFYRLNIEVDLIPDSLRDFSGYALVVTPCLYCASEALIGALRDFVTQGGCLLSTFRSFFADEKGRVRTARRPYGMTDVFSMSCSEFTIPEEVCLPEYVSEVSDYMELLEPEDAMGLAIYDSPAWRGVPAACCSRFGRGQAAYFGCYSEDGFEPVLLRLLAMWHIPVPESAWPVVQKRGTNKDGKSVTFLLHYSPASRVVPSPATGTELFSGKHLDEGEPLELKGWDVKILEGDL